MSHSNEISRRTLITGIVAGAAVPALARQALARAPAEATQQDTQTGQASLAAVPRYLSSSVALRDGRVLVSGGYQVGEQARQQRFVAPSSSVQIFNPARSTWQNAAAMSHPRARHASVLLDDGRVAVLGGFYSRALDSVEIYDPVSNTWSKGEPLPQPMCDITACLAQGKIVISGGASGTPALVIGPIPIRNQP